MMNREIGHSCAHSGVMSGEFPVGDAACRLVCRDTTARSNGVVEVSRCHSAGLDDLRPSLTLPDSNEFDQSCDLLNSTPVQKTSSMSRNCNSSVKPQSSYAHEKVGERSSLMCKWRELRNCTEELGAESSSCSVDAELEGASGIRHEALSREIKEVNIARKSRSTEVGETSSSSCEFPGLAARQLSRFERSTFPPPLSSLVSNRLYLRSFKSNGRFVLQRVVMPSRSSFRATRRDGRLKLELVSPAPCSDVEAEDEQLPESTSCPSDEERGVDITSPAQIKTPEARKSLANVHTRLIIAAGLPFVSSASTCVRGGVALKSRTDPFLFNFRKQNRNLLVSKEDAHLISAYNDFPANWQLPFVGPQRPSSQSNVGDQLTYSDGRSHRRGNQCLSTEAQHGFAIFKLNPFKLLFFHFQRFKGGFKINGVYCFKDAELGCKKGGIIEPLLDNWFGNFYTVARGKDESFSLQFQECRSQWKEEKTGLEPAEGFNYFEHETDCSASPKGGISSFSRFFQTHLTLCVST